MVKKVALVFFILIGIKGISQIQFEKGYFVNNEGVRVDCFIKNEGWLSNPAYFDYKTDSNAEIKRETIKNVMSFSVADEYKFERSSVEIDRAPTKYNSLDNVKKINPKQETLFLKILLEGEASLYSYVDKSFTAFFYKNKEEALKTLLFKKYKDGYGNVLKNKHYRQQLLTDLPCDGIDINYITDVDYKTDDLIKFFVKYNTCVNSDITLIGVDKQKKKPLNFNLRIRPGVNLNRLSLKRDKGSNGSLAINRDVDFGYKSTFRLGTELELILPFKKNKWSVFVEPTYQYFNGEEEIVYIETRPEPRTVTVDYSSIELPIGIRHYFFLNKDSKLFVNAAFVMDFVLKSDIEYEEEPVLIHDDISFGDVSNFSFGAGYNYKKYTFEIRGTSNRNFYGGLQSAPSRKSKYGSISFIVGYKLF